MWRRHCRADRSSLDLRRDDGRCVPRGTDRPRRLPVGLVSRARVHGMLVGNGRSGEDLLVTGRSNATTGRCIGRPQACFESRSLTGRQPEAVASPRGRPCSEDDDLVEGRVETFITSGRPSSGVAQPQALGRSTRGLPSEGSGPSPPPLVPRPRASRLARSSQCSGRPRAQGARGEREARVAPQQRAFRIREYDAMRELDRELLGSDPRRECSALGGWGQ